MYDSAKNQYKEYWKDSVKHIPKVDLEEKHIANTKLLTNRRALLELLPKNAVIAELGVAQGVFTDEILATCSPSKCHLIDFWDFE